MSADSSYCSWCHHGWHEVGVKCSDCDCRDAPAPTADPVDLAGLVEKVADSWAWPVHGIRYADDDAMQCMCGWNADGHPDRAREYLLHTSTIAIAAAGVPDLLRTVAEQAEEIARLRAEIAAHTGELDRVTFLRAGAIVAERDAERAARETAEANSAKWRHDWHRSDRLRLEAEARAETAEGRITAARTYCDAVEREWPPHLSERARVNVDAIRQLLDGAS